MSVSVFVARLELDATTIYINYLRDCYPEIKNQVAFHFLSPIENTDSIDVQLKNEAKNVTLELISGIVPCQPTKEMLKNTLVHQMRLYIPKTLKFCPIF